MPLASMTSQNQTIARVDAAGKVQYTTFNTAYTSGSYNKFRSIFSLDGNAYLLAGSSTTGSVSDSGVHYIEHGSTSGTKKLTNDPVFGGDLRAIHADTSVPGSPSILVASQDTNYHGVVRLGANYATLPFYGPSNPVPFTLLNGFNWIQSTTNMYDFCVQNASSIISTDFYSSSVALKQYVFNPRAGVWERVFQIAIDTAYPFSISLECRQESDGFIAYVVAMCSGTGCNPSSRLYRFNVDTKVNMLVANAPAGRAFRAVTFAPVDLAFTAASPSVSPLPSATPSATSTGSSTGTPASTATPSPSQPMVYVGTNAPTTSSSSTPVPTPNPGNVMRWRSDSILVLRLGNFTGSTSTVATDTVWIDEYRPDGLGGPLSSFALPSFGIGPLCTISGRRDIDSHFPTMSDDGRYILFGCFDQPAGYSFPSGYAGTYKVIARIDAYGNIDLSTRFNDGFIVGSYPKLRAIASADGNVFYMTGGAGSGITDGGIRAIGLGQNYSTRITQQAGVGSDGRFIHSSGGKLYVAFQDGSAVPGGTLRGIGQVGYTFPPRPCPPGLDVLQGGCIANEAVNLLPGFPAMSSTENSYDFCFQDANTMWSADFQSSLSQLILYTFNSVTGVWTKTSTYQISATFTGIFSVECRNDAVEGNAFTIYIVGTRTSVAPFSQMYRFNTVSRSFVTMATSVGQTVMRGVVFAPTVSGGVQPAAINPSPSNAATPAFTPSPTTTTAGGLFTPLPTKTPQGTGANVFQSTSLLMARVGPPNSPAPPSGLLAPVFIDEVDAVSGIILQTIALPNTTNGGTRVACTIAGYTDQDSLFMSQSGDGKFAYLPCWNADAGTSEPPAGYTTRNTVQQVVAIINWRGEIDLSTRFNDAFIGPSYPKFRSVASQDNTILFLSGGAGSGTIDGGVRFTIPGGSSTSRLAGTASLGSDVRMTHTYNGRLFTAFNDGYHGVAEIGYGLAGMNLASNTNEIRQLPGFTALSPATNMYDFCIENDTSIWATDMTSGYQLRHYIFNVLAGQWVQWEYYNLDSIYNWLNNIECRVEGQSYVIYALTQCTSTTSGANFLNPLAKVYRFDATQKTFSLVAGAPTNDQWHGLAFAPYNSAAAAPAASSTPSSTSAATSTASITGTPRPTPSGSSTPTSSGTAAPTPTSSVAPNTVRFSLTVSFSLGSAAAANSLASNNSALQSIRSAVACSMGVTDGSRVVINFLSFLTSIFPFSGTSPANSNGGSFSTSRCGSFSSAGRRNSRLLQGSVPISLSVDVFVSDVNGGEALAAAQTFFANTGIVIAPLTASGASAIPQNPNATNGFASVLLGTDAGTLLTSINGGNPPSQVSVNGLSNAPANYGQVSSSTSSSTTNAIIGGVVGGVGGLIVIAVIVFFAVRSYKQRNRKSIWVKELAVPTAAASSSRSSKKASNEEEEDEESKKVENPVVGANNRAASVGKMSSSAIKFAPTATA
jgi:hypothetical protein